MDNYLQSVTYILYSVQMRREEFTRHDIIYNGVIKLSVSSGSFNSSNPRRIIIANPYKL